MYAAPGSYSPQPNDGRYTPQSPLNGLQQNGCVSPGRPRSSMRSPMRPSSRYDVMVEVGFKIPSLNLFVTRLGVWSE